MAASPSMSPIRFDDEEGGGLLPSACQHSSSQQPGWRRLVSREDGQSFEPLCVQVQQPLPRHLVVVRGVRVVRVGRLLLLLVVVVVVGRVGLLVLVLGRRVGGGAVVGGRAEVHLRPPGEWSRQAASQGGRMLKASI